MQREKKDEMNVKLIPLFSTAYEKPKDNESQEKITFKLNSIPMTTIFLRKKIQWRHI